MVRSLAKIAIRRWRMHVILFKKIEKHMKKLEKNGITWYNV